MQSVMPHPFIASSCCRVQCKLGYKGLKPRNCQILLNHAIKLKGSTHNCADACRSEGMPIQLFFKFVSL